MISPVENSACVTGEYRAPASAAGGDAISRLGFGVYWRETDRLVFFGDANWGLTDPSPDTALTLGLSFSF